MRRTLKLDGYKEVYVDVFQPEIDRETDNHYICRFNIDGLSSPVSSAGMGVDGVQAMRIAFELIGNILYSCQEFRDGRLTWSCATEHGDLGFPTAS